MKTLIHKWKLKLVLGLVLMLISAGAMAQVTVTGASGITDGTSYTTLKLAFDAINGKTQTAANNILVAISDNTTETATAALTQGDWNSLTIYPTTTLNSTGKTITGNFAGSVINLNGADRVTIDGRFGMSGSSKDLTISNIFTTVATASQAIQLIADASNNTIKYCTIKGVSVAATNGTVLIGAGTTTGNDNNKIEYCDIADGATMPACGICFNGSSATVTNDANTVSNCNIYNVTNTTAAAAYGINVNANTNSTTINANRVYWISTITPAVAVIYNGIRTTGKSTVISNNIVGYSSSTGSGTATFTPSVASATGFKGIDAAGDATYATTITGNTVGGIQFTSNGALGTGSVYGVAAGIFANFGRVNIGTTSSDFNTIKDITLILTTSSTSYYVLNGIVGTGVDAISAKYNKIFNLKSYGTTNGIVGHVRGMQFGHPTGTRSASLTVVGNEIHDLEAGTATSTAGNSAYGIQGSLTGTTLIDKNYIYNIRALNASTTYASNVYGISTAPSDANGNSFTVSNNMITLGNDLTANGPSIHGLYMSNVPVTNTAIRVYYYHNSVYIGGSTPGTANTTVTAVLNKLATGAVTGLTTIKNNIFVNVRTGGAGNHYLMKLAAATDYTSGYAIYNYNLYKMGSAANSKFGIVATTIVPDFTTTAATSWQKLNAALDPNGKEGDPVYSDATNATTPNLHIGALSPAKGAAENLSSVVGYDIDGDTRGGGNGNQDMGADDISNASVAVSIFNKTVPANTTYAYNTNLDFTVEYTKAVTVAGGTPYIPITLSNSSVVNATLYSGSGTKTLTFRYTTGANVTSTGITVGDINLNGATIVSGSDNAPLSISTTLAAVNIDATYGTSVTAVSTPVVPTNGQATITYWTGAVLDYNVTFGEAVNVTGTPRIPITNTITAGGSATVYANYLSGSGTNTLTFRYIVGTSDAAGTITTGSAIELNGGTIKTTSLNMNSVLTLNNITPTGKTLKIDDIATSTNERRWLTFSAPASGTYGIGQNIDIVVGASYLNSATSTTTAATALYNFSYTSGTTPYIPLTLDNNVVVRANCISGSGTITSTQTKTFRYTVVSGNVDADGIVIGNIELNGSTINYGSGATQAGQTVTFASTPVVKIVNAVIPSISSVTTTSSTYGIGQSVKFKVKYSEAVSVTGTPSLPIVIGSTTQQATYESGSGSTDLTFGYTVASGDEDVDGVTLGAEISLNSGTIKNTSNIDAATGIMVGITGTAKIANVVMPYVTSVTYPANGTYGLGSTLDIVVTTSEAVNVTGSPYFPVGLAAGNWPGAYYVSGSGTSTLTFRYTVGANALNTTGLLIGNLIALNGGTLKDATNTYDMTLYKGSQTSSLPNVFVDANAVYTWTGTTSNDWNVSSNWQGNVAPLTTNSVSIPATSTQPLVGATSACKDLTIDNSASLTINPSGNLSVSGNLTNNGSLTIKSDATGSAQLKITGTSTGNVVFERYMTGKKYHLIASPVSGQTIENFLSSNSNISSATIPGKSIRAMADYNSSTNNWNSYYSATGQTGDVTVGKGYLIRTKDAVGGTVTMTGALQPADASIAVNTDWNCIGNPFTTAISTSSLLTANDAEFSNINNDGLFKYIYVWDNSGSGQYNTSVTSVQAGQAFMVRMKEGAANFAIAKTAQSADVAIPFRSASQLEWSDIKLSVSDGTDNYYTEVKFNDAMTTGPDAGFDAGLLRSNKDFAIYTRLLNGNATDICMQALPTTTEAIPVGLDYTAGGSITFTAAGFPEGYNVVLEDRQAKTFTDLSGASASYTASVAANTAGTGRFYLYANPNKITTGVKATNGSTLSATVVGKQLKVNGEVSKNAIVTIYDVAGKVAQVSLLEAGSANTVNLKIGAGVYVVKVADVNNQYQTKIVIR